MPLEAAFAARDTDHHSLWQTPEVRDGRPLDTYIETPALLQSVRVDPNAYARHITATQIADLGGQEIDPFYARRFRRSILHDAPATIEQISQLKPETVAQRIIGDMVHRVLGQWHVLEQSENLEKILESYAWELGVVDVGQRAYAVQEARNLLQQTRHSEVFDWLREAVTVYRELPFIYRTDQRIIHGVLDALFQRSDATWVVVDYKTSYVEGGNRDKKLVIDHARRYHLQVGVYAAAVSEQLGRVPQTFIHYIRYGLTIPVEAEAWQSALGKLENFIGEVLRE
jgi:regulator of extracellular matrix RemA (YlzA/DUF370 family)